MALEDKVLGDEFEPQAADFVDRDIALLDDDEILVICGVEFPAVEFVEAERATWIEIRDKYRLVETEQKYRELLAELSKTDNSHLLNSKRERLNATLAEITRLNKETAPLDWTSELEEYSNKLAQQADRLEQEVSELAEPQDQKFIARIEDIQLRLRELKDARDPAFLEMSWRIAKAKFDEDRSLEEWIHQSHGSDRLAAQELVYKGNFSWEAQRLTRTQRRALLKTHRKQKNQGGTIASTS